jgi:hypothetical protein
MNDTETPTPTTAPPAPPAYPPATVEAQLPPRPVPIADRLDAPALRRLCRLLAERATALRAAVDAGAVNAMAGNGVDALREAAWQDDQAVERISKAVAEAAAATDGRIA